MSLKFGLYLVEQGIITCDQFCGLVKIQQETRTSLGSIAIQKNIMTIKQVANVLEYLETAPGETFIEAALKADFIERADASELQKLEQLSRPHLRQIIVNVGLMTERQVAMLFEHFKRVETRLRKAKAGAPTQKAAPAQAARPRQPKFRQRPVIVNQNYTGTL